MYACPMGVFRGFLRERGAHTRISSVSGLEKNHENACIGLRREGLIGSWGLLGLNVAQQPSPRASWI